MNKPTKARRKKVLTGNIIQIDTETGEMTEVLSESGDRLSLDKETGEYVLKSNDFVTSDRDVEEYVMANLSPVDYKRFRQMAWYLHTPFNIVLSGNNCPHTLETLANAINQKEDDTRRLINRLIAKDLVRWVICPESGHEKKIIMLNPFVIRKRTGVNKHLLEIFPDFKYDKTTGTVSLKKFTATVPNDNPYKVEKMFDSTQGLNLN